MSCTVSSDFKAMAFIIGEDGNFVLLATQESQQENETSAKQTKDLGKNEYFTWFILKPSDNEQVGFLFFFFFLFFLFYFFFLRFISFIFFYFILSFYVTYFIFIFPTFSFTFLGFCLLEFTFLLLF